MLLAVPAQKSTDTVGVVGGEGDIGFPAEAVGSKVFAHVIDSFQMDSPTVYSFLLRAYARRVKIF
jgi:hypothetical protein